MKPKMSKTQMKQQQLLKEFSLHDALSIEEICSLLDCKRRSAYNYINRLEENGYSFEIYTKNNNAFYHLNPENISDDLYYEPITLDLLRKYTIAKELQQKPLTKQELTQRFTVSKGSITLNPGNYCILLDVQEAKFNRLVNELIDSDDLEFDVSTQTYYLTGRKIPLQLDLDYDKLYDLNIELASISNGNSYSSELNSLYNKTCQLLGCLDTADFFFKHYIVSGKKLDGLTTVVSRLDKLADIDYKKHIMRITYTNKKGQTLTTFFALGKIIYVIEKDSLYLLGKSYSEKVTNDESIDMILNVSRIQNIEELIFTHDCYNSSHYQEIVKNMFSISINEPIKVTVEFDRFGNIERKIRYLTYQRQGSASYEVKDNKIIYTDSISGLSDFAAYLRKFGKSVHVIEPQELKDKLAFSVTRTLNRYKEVLENEEI